jgi:hypothetical protein
VISALLVGRWFGFGIPGAEELTTRTAAAASTRAAAQLLTFSPLS